MHLRFVPCLLVFLPRRTNTTFIIFSPSKIPIFTVAPFSNPTKTIETVNGRNLGKHPRVELEAELNVIRRNQLKRSPAANLHEC